MSGDGAYTPRDLAALATGLFRDGPWVLRQLQRWRVYICPFERVIAEVPLRSRVLDVGCGGGLFLGLLAATGRLRAGFGFDTSGPAIETARAMTRRVDDDEVELVFERRDVATPWPEGPYDVVALVDVLHHVPRAYQRSVIEDAAARVGPGGIFLYKDMCVRPRWRAAANRLHDLVMARQWIHEVPVETVEGWAQDAGLARVSGKRINRWWYGHDLVVFGKGAAASD